MSIGTMKMADGLPATFVAGSGKQITNSGGFALCLAGVKKSSQSLAEQCALPIDTGRYRISDGSYIDGVPAYEIMDKETEKALYIRERDLVIQKDAGSGMAFLINMDQPFSCNVQVTGELRALLGSIAQKRGLELPEVPLKGGLSVHQDPKTGLQYLAIEGDEARGMSLILNSKEDGEKVERLINEFMQYSVSAQRGTAELYALLEISGNLKRDEQGMAILKPDGISYVPYDGDEKKAWNLSMSAADYITARAYLAMGGDFADAQTWLGWIDGAKLFGK